MNTARYTVTAVVTFRGDERRHLLGTAATRRQARRMAYRCGLMRVPSRFSAEMFDQMTVGERGIW